MRFTADRMNLGDSIKEGDTVSCHWSSRVRAYRTKDDREMAAQELNGWGVKKENV